MSFELPLRHPETLGKALEDDLVLCGNALDASVESLRERVRTAITVFRQRTALSELISAEKLRPDPFFGWLVVKEGDQRKRFRIGQVRYPELRIVDWRHPLGGHYYHGEIGTSYERSGGRGPHHGTLLARARLSHERRALLSAHWEDTQGVLEVERSGDTFELRSDAGAGHLPSGLPNILAFLTPAQYALISRSSDRALIIQGRAGSGKTTVALHRLSWLAFPRDEDDEDTPPLAPERTLIVMFNRALCAFVRGLLEPLGLEAAELRTFHSWALRTLRNVYRGELELDTDEHPDQEAAAPLKAQLGILDAIQNYVDAQTQRLETWLESMLTPYDGAAYLERFTTSDAPVLRRVIALRKGALAARNAAKTPRERRRLEQIYRIFRRAVLRMSLYKQDLQAILTDTELLARSLPGVEPEAIAALARYQRARQCRDGTKVGPWIDFDDLALLLRIMQVKHGGLPTANEDVFHFDHLMIDEAQDFGAVQLQVLLAAVKTRSGVTIVGDVNQKILPGVHFMGWSALATELGLHGSEVAQLEIGHRSTAPIVAVADTLVGQEPGPGREGERPLHILTEDEDESFERLAELLSDRAAAAPHAHLCVVCGRRSRAEGVHARLAEALHAASFPVRLGHNRDFVFAPGVTVTNKQQVKGLEFDTVYVFEPDPEYYPEDEQGRRDLYVVTSRAQERLVFIGHATPSPLLDAVVEANLVDRVEPAFQEVVFSEEDDVPM